MTSDEVLALDKVPSRIAVIGGGAIGCEFASCFADLGANVTILEGLPKILPGLDPDVANVVVKSFKKKNIDIKTGVKVIDMFTPLCAGQRIGIFAGSGVGKSTLLAMLARSKGFDTAVIALVGERGREVRAVDYLQARRSLDPVQESFIELFEQRYDAILTPAAPGPADTAPPRGVPAPDAFRQTLSGDPGFPESGDHRCAR